MDERAMTVEELEDVLRVLNGGTPGELVLYQSGTQTREEMLAYFAQATTTHESTNLYAIGIAGELSGGVPKIIALTGNGPDAEANVQRLAVAAYIAPKVIGVLAQFIQAVDAARAALAAGDVAAADAALVRGMTGRE